jgi:hypothetical protein
MELKEEENPGDATAGGSISTYQTLSRFRGRCGEPVYASRGCVLPFSSRAHLCARELGEKEDIQGLGKGKKEEEEQTKWVGASLVCRAAQSEPLERDTTCMENAENMLLLINQEEGKCSILPPKRY